MNQLLASLRGLWLRAVGPRTSADIVADLSRLKAEAAEVSDLNQRSAQFFSNLAAAHAAESERAANLALKINA